MFSTLLSCGDVDVQPMSCLYTAGLWSTGEWESHKIQHHTGLGKQYLAQLPWEDRRKKADSSFCLSHPSLLSQIYPKEKTNLGCPSLTNGCSNLKGYYNIENLPYEATKNLTQFLNLDPDSAVINI